MAGSGRRGPHDRALGAWGEQVACEHVQGLGWQVLDRNWRCSAGELDLVAHDPHTGTLVFIEVKTRAGEGFGQPLEAVTYRKQRRLRELALHWLRAHAEHPHAARLRIDAIGVLKRGERAPRIDHAIGVTA